MRDADRYKLIDAPYRPPDVKVGDMVKCKMYGLVEVGGWTDAPIAWPRAKKTGRPQLILTGDLVRAVKTESEIAISYHWGVSITTVWKWRKALGIGRVTQGTARLYREYQPEKLPDELGELSRELCRTPEARAKMAETKRGKKMPPRSAEYRKKVSKRVKKEWAEEKRTRRGLQKRLKHGKLLKRIRSNWETEKIITPIKARYKWMQWVWLMGRIPDLGIERLSGISQSRIWGHRNKLRIPAYQQIQRKNLRWKDWEKGLILLGVNDEQVATWTGRSHEAVIRQRYFLRVKS